MLFKGVCCYEKKKVRWRLKRNGRKKDISGGGYPAGMLTVHHSCGGDPEGEKIAPLLEGFFYKVCGVLYLRPKKERRSERSRLGLVGK